MIRPERLTDHRPTSQYLSASMMANVRSLQIGLNLHRVWSSVNTYNNTTQVHSRQLIDPKLILTIFDARSKNSLWSTVDHRRLARMEKNREKEMINSAERLVEELQSRSDTSK